MIQSRVLFALLMREMTSRYGRSAGGYVWAVLDPVLTVALLTAIFAQISRHPPIGNSFPLFYATGYMAFHIYKDVSSAVSNAIVSNKPLLTFPRVTVLDTIIARFVLQTFTCLFVTFIVLGCLHVFSPDRATIDFSAIFLVIGVTLFLGFCIGSLNSILFPYSPTWQRLFGVINRPLFLISGVFFVFEDLPKWIQDILWWNPLIHTLALMRVGFYPTYQPTFISISYVITFASVSLMFFILLLRVLRGRILEQ